MRNYLSRHKNFSVTLLCLLFFAGGFFLSKIINKPLIIKTKVLRQSGFEYINPVLLCNINNNQKYNENTDLSKKLLEYTKNKTENDISVYFLSLVGGGWASVNGDEIYSPASMLKVPEVLDTLRLGESNPDILSKQVYYDGIIDDNKAEYFPAKQYIRARKYYTVGELLPYIIKYSDNNALELLEKNISLNSLGKIYKDLNIEIPPNTLNIMSAKTYSLILRILYNSTYLNRENSEQVLKLMAESDFSFGLRAGVPKEISVAEKFGERELYTPEGVLIERELHDCGIIYLVQKPYILCVMTRGKDFQSLANSIRDISNIVYKEVAK